MAKLEKSIDDLEGTLPFKSYSHLHFLYFPPIFILNLWFLFFSLLISLHGFLHFPPPPPAVSLSLCPPLTCRRTVHSEAEVQGYQRGAGSCPQWYEHLVNVEFSSWRFHFSLSFTCLEALFLLSSLFLLSPLLAPFASNWISIKLFFSFTLSSVISVLTTLHFLYLLATVKRTNLVGVFFLCLL